MKKPLQKDSILIPSVYIKLVAFKFKEYYNIHDIIVQTNKIV